MSTCRHCEQPCDPDRGFCCEGCESAYNLKADLTKDSQPLPMPPDPEASYVFDAFVKTDDKDVNSLVLGVEGVHCAACIQKIESALNREPDVKTGRLNFSTRRLTVEWMGPRARGNELAAIVGRLGYRVRPFDPAALREGSAAEERFLLICLAVAGFAAGNIMMISVGLWASSQEIMGMAMRDFMHWMAAVIALPAISYAGQPFFRSAWGALKQGRTNMDVPISLAVILACGMSLYETIHHGAHAYFDSATMLMFFLLIGRYLDFRARRSARSSATDLLGMLSGTATVIEDGQRPRVIPIKDVREDMILQVAVGEKMPADGILLEGSTEVDASLITGESLPQTVKAGDAVFAGTMNLSVPVRVRVSKASDDSLLSDIVRLMEKAEQGQAQYVRLADKAARLYTPVVHTLAAATFLGWWLLGGLVWQEALMIAVTVLIITCPCALGLAVPVVQVLATGRLMKRGVLVKSGDALERLAGIDMALFDKTGTLTLGRPALENSDSYEDEDLKYAASLAAHSRHPLSKAVVSAYDDGAFLDVAVQDYPGKGLESTYKGQTIRLGSRVWCGDEKAPHDPSKLELWLSVSGRAPVRFLFSDPLRADARTVLDELKDEGLSLVLLSGDRKEAVAAVATDLGIDNAQGGLSPVDKFAALETLQKQGHKLLMVGDGLNDAPVLAGADVSMSPSTAIDIAQNTADIVFMGDKLYPIREAWYVSRKTQKLVKQNFALAVLYNMIAVPLAVTGLVTPLIAALAMSGSSLIVVANSFRLHTRKGAVS